MTEQAPEKRAELRPSPLFIAAKEGASETLVALLGDPSAERWAASDRKQGLSPLAPLSANGAKTLGYDFWQKGLAKVFAALEGDLVAPMGRAAWALAGQELPAGRESMAPLELAMENWSYAGGRAAEEAARLARGGAEIAREDLAGALRAAARSGHLACVRPLLEIGADPNLADERGNAALHVCKDSKSVEALLSAGANPLAANAAGKTPLEIAAATGRDDIAKMLFAEAKRREKAGRKRGEKPAEDSPAPLFAALANKSALMFRSMLSRGLFDVRGARDAASGRSLLEIAIEQAMWVDARKLVEKGASLNDESKQGRLLWGETARHSLGYSRRQSDAAAAEKFWGWADEGGHIDWAGRRSDGFAEIDDLAGEMNGRWSKGGDWKHFERKALAAGLERSPLDWARLTARFAEMACRGDVSSLTIIGKTARSFGEAENKDLEEGFREMAAKAKGCPEEAAAALLSRVALAFANAYARNPLKKVALGMLEDAMELFPDAPLEIPPERFRDAEDAPALALAQRRQMDLALRAEAGGSGPASGKRKGL